MRKHNTRSERVVYQWYEKTLKKNQAEIEIKFPYIKQKYSGKPFQQTRTSGRQNFRAWRQKRLK
jgi:hypothetical protein